MLQTNKFHVVGSLISVNSKVGTFKQNGHNFIDVTATVKSVINGQDNIFKIKFFSSDTKADGTKNKMFNVYSSLEKNYKDRRISVDGSIKEDRFVSDKDNQMHTFQHLEGKWINAAGESEVDEATWSVGGFVAKDLEEKTNKNNEIYRYDFTLGQSNYKGDNMSLFTFHIAPGDNVILNGIRKYKVGDTITLNGKLNFIETIAVVEDKNNAFGDPVTKTFVNHNNSYFITGGTNPITDATDPNKYTNQVITSLVAAYKASGVEIQQKASTSKTTAPVETNEAPKPSVRQTSLI